MSQAAILHVAPNQAEADVMVRLRGVTKSYQRAGATVPVLSDINLELKKGGFLALMGPSGSGKTTLLNLIAGLDRPTSGSTHVAGVNLAGMSDQELTRFRARSVGFVFQTYNLLPVLTAVQNVALP